MSEVPDFSSEWEWGWKTPLLLFPSTDFSRGPDALPPAISALIAAPLDEFDLFRATQILAESFANLKTSRVGIRFERIQAALFRSHPATASLRTGIQIPEVTEIDLLQKIHALPGVVIHWEVAVKFYLAMDPDGSNDPDRWIGPSQKDSLGVKMRAVRDRQLAALSNPRHARAVGISEDEKLYALPKVHGVLFTPWKSGMPYPSPTKNPPGVNPNGMRGIWFSESDSEKFLRERANRFPNDRIFILHDRKEWIRCHRRAEWISRAGGMPEIFTEETNLKNHFNFRLKTLTGSDSPEKEPFQGLIIHGGEEIRFFCVPDSWADTAEGSLETLRARSRIKA